MKIKTKIIGFTMGVLFISFLCCGAFSVNHFLNTSLKQMAQNEMEKLELAERTFRQVGTREDFEQMGELARDAYLKYQFERCYKKGYALFKDMECLKNLTGYEVIHPDAMEEDYAIQKIQGVWILITKQPLEYPKGYWVMSVKNITQAWSQAREQAGLYFLVFLLAFAGAGAALTLFIRHILGALEKLRQQAEAISQGDFSRKVKIKSRDELAALSGSLNSMSDRIEQQIEDLELLLGALAHEMKTPVTNIKGYADSLLHVRLNDCQKEQALEAIERSARRLDQMAGKLLQLIGLYENQEFQVQWVKVGRLLRQVCQEQKEKVKEKEIHITVGKERNALENCREFPGDFQVKGDELLLYSLFENIISNSIKAIEKGGEIHIELFNKSVSISDNGCGIAQSDLPHVKKAFYMADKARSRRQQGAGLGLALADRIVKAHQGTMELESVKGEGTKVTVVFGESRSSM